MRPTNFEFNDPAEAMLNGTALSRGVNRVAVELCVAGPCRFAKLARAVQFKPDFLAKVLKDPRFHETPAGWDLRPVRTETPPDAPKRKRTPPRPNRAGKTPRTT